MSAAALPGPVPGFTDASLRVRGQQIAYSVGGSGPPVLLLHGFPQTRAMWHAIAPRMARDFTVVCADLRGYGASAKPEGTAAYAFREMAADQVALMQALGHGQFHAIGHDRGARTVHRMALDHPQAVLSAALLDIVPTRFLLENLTHQAARAYYHWFFLSQPAPLPERMIEADPDSFYTSCLLGWGGASLADFDAGALAHYRAAWRAPAQIHATCNDYRAAIDVDIGHDAEDAEAGRKVTCPALVLYGADGAMARAFDVPATWAPCLTDMRAAALPGGHFFPDQFPDETAQALQRFLAGV